MVVFKRLSRVALLATVACLPKLAYAQSTPQPETAIMPPSQDANNQAIQFDEILVTAQKREQNVQDVPIAISAFSGATLAQRGTQSIDSLTSLAPGLSGHATSSTQQAYTIRGVGSNDFSVGNDPAVGIYLDEVYIGRAAGAVTNIFDLARVEVVRGPQGTLFGRNATAGAISVFRNAPSNTLEGFIEGQYARFNDYTMSGVLNLPVTDDVALRGSLYYRSKDGDRNRPLGGSALEDMDTFSGRLAAKLQASEAVRVDVNFDYQRDRNSPPALHSRTYNGSLVNPGFYETTSNGTRAELFNNREINNLSGKLTADLGEATLTSISSFRKYKVDYLEDFDGGPTTLVKTGPHEEQKAYSQELRLNGDTGNLNWTVGGNIYHEKVSQIYSVYYDEEAICGGLARASGLPTIPCGVLLAALSGSATPIPYVGKANVHEANFSNGNYTSWGLYADGTYRFDDHLELTMGGRYSRDNKRIDINTPNPGATLAPIALGAPSIFLQTTNGIIHESRSWGNFSPRAILRYIVNPGLNAYASFSRGYKSGGFNTLTPSGGIFNPEHVSSYELGLKGRAFDGRVQFNLAGYYYTYTDLQVQVISLVSFTQNAGKARGYGVEMSLSARPFKGLTLSPTLSLLDASYQDYVPSVGVSYKGNKLNRSPAVSGSFSATYGFGLGNAGDFEISSETRFQRKQYFDPGNTALQRGDGFVVSDLRATYKSPSDRWELTGFVKNLFGEKYIVTTRVIAPVNAATYRAGDQRTFGVRARYRF
jgi:iron complex outermembrane recepter protein